MVCEAVMAVRTYCLERQESGSKRQIQGQSQGKMEPREGYKGMVGVRYRKRKPWLKEQNWERVRGGKWRGEVQKVQKGGGGGKGGRGEPRSDCPAAPRCRCARRCCRSCATPCLAERPHVPAGAGALVARAGPCCRCARSARCDSATASSTRPARAGTRARTGVRSASWTTPGLLGDPGPRLPRRAHTCASARSADASRRCELRGPGRPRVAWVPQRKPPARLGRGQAPPDPAS